MFRLVLGLAVAVAGAVTIHNGVSATPPMNDMKVIGAGMIVVALILLFGGRRKKS